MAEESLHTIIARVGVIEALKSGKPNQVELSSLNAEQSPVNIEGKNLAFNLTQMNPTTLYIGYYPENSDKKEYFGALFCDGTLKLHSLEGSE